MRYRTRLTVLLVALTVVTSGVLVGLSYRLTRGILVREIESKVLSIAGTAAALVDGDLHAQIHSREDEGSGAYRSVETQLRRVRDINRRGDVFIRYVYTMDRPAELGGRLSYVVDAEESDSQNKSHVGDRVTSDVNDPTLLKLDTYHVEPFVTDEFGTWLSANAPIRDGEGKVVGALGVDMAAHDVLEKTKLLLWRGLLAMLAAVGLACGIAWFLSRLVTRPLDQLAVVVNRIGQGDFDARVNLPNRDEFGQLGQAVNHMAGALRERELLKGALARYLSQQVADEIIRTGTIPQLKGERRKITVLFLDIRNFTRMADHLAPEEVVEVLNEFFARMIEVIFKYHGTLDKFTGDGLMAIFGAPFEDPEQEYHAGCAAVEMQRELERLRARWSAEGREQLRIGMGINTGIAVVGNIGSAQRMDYTAIGDTVNLAARLESATKDHGVSVLISDRTYLAIRKRLPARYIATVQVRGRSAPVAVYTLVDPNEASVEQTLQEEEAQALAAPAPPSC